MYEALMKTKGNIVSNVSGSKTKRLRLTLPWWCLFVAYGHSFLLVGVSIFFIIARSIEFGDLITQKWLRSVVIGFFSSICFTQPLKVCDLNCSNCRC
jgi:hypothetical protein